MEKKSVKLIAKTLSKLLPVLNLVSTIADVVELIGIVKAMIQGHVGGGGDESGSQEEPAGGSAEENSAQGHGRGDDGPDVSDHSQHHGAEPSASTESGSTEAKGASNPVKVDPKQIEEARNALSPNARTVIDAVLHKGAKAPVLDPDQLRMAGLLVPASFSAEEVREVVSTLRVSAPIAQTPEDAIVAIDQAVRNVRNNKRTVTIDGVAHPDLARPAPDDQGPITSPRQVDAEPDGYDEMLAIIRTAPPALIGRWFQARDRELVINAEGTDWKARHLNTRVAGQMLRDVQYDVTSRGDGKWNLRLVFKLQASGGRQLYQHDFFVDRDGEGSGLGARVGELIFEPYTMVSFH